MQSLPAHLQEYLITNAVNVINQQKIHLFKYVHAELKRRTLRICNCVNTFWFGLSGYWASADDVDNVYYFSGSTYKFACYSRDWQIEPVN